MSDTPGPTDVIPRDDPLNPRGTPDVLRDGEGVVVVKAPDDLSSGDTPEARDWMPDPRQTLVGPGTEDLRPGDSFEPQGGATPPGYYDNPLNPRGVPDCITEGAPDAQAMDAQKAQNPYPQRPASNPRQVSAPERVSAGQNRQPPNERFP